MISTTPLLPESYFHEDSGSVRFWVRNDAGEFVGASVRKETLKYRYDLAIGGGADALKAYQAHREEIDAAVRRRIARGSIEPVMLREPDLAAPPAR